MESSSLVITLSEGWAQFVRGFAPRAQVAVLPNSVALPPPGTGAAGDEGRILFLGRLEEAKGVFELLHACALLAPRFPAIRLVLGGEGDANAVRRRASELGVAERIELPGWIGPEQRAHELRRAQVFCLPSHAEGLPMALLEAMAAGKAVVASSVGGIPEAISDGDNGLLVPPHASQALAGALAGLLGDEALRRRMGRRARETVEQHYSLDAVGARLGQIYHELEGD
jgi:glycosyltransferase involved in cell wall biosynthesis